MQFLSAPLTHIFLRSRNFDLSKLLDKFYIITSSPGKLHFAQKCILGEWLYNVTKGIGCVCSVSKSSIGCWKVCGNDRLRCSVQSGHMVAEGSVKPLSVIICLMKWGALQLPCLSYPISQHIAMLTHYFSDILNEYIIHLIPANLPVKVMNKLIHKWM